MFIGEKKQKKKKSNSSFRPLPYPKLGSILTLTPFASSIIFDSVIEKLIDHKFKPRLNHLI